MTAQANPVAAGALLRLEVATRADVVYIRLVGEMDISTRGSLEETLSNGDLRGAAQVRLDLTELTFCDASGVAELVAAHQAATRQNRMLAAHGASPQVRRVLALTGTTFVLGAGDEEPPTDARHEAVPGYRIALP